MQVTVRGGWTCQPPSHRRFAQVLTSAATSQLGPRYTAFEFCKTSIVGTVMSALKWVVLMMFGGMLNQVSAQKVDTIRVQVHGHEIVLYASGAGPAVVLEAGGGSSSRLGRGNPGAGETRSSRGLRPTRIRSVAAVR